MEIIWFKVVMLNSLFITTVWGMNTHIYKIMYHEVFHCLIHTLRSWLFNFSSKYILLKACL